MIPDQQRRRLLSVRAYDERHYIVDAEVVPGTELETLIDRFFADPRVAYLHVHNARRGCYACRVDRVEARLRRLSLYRTGGSAVDPCVFRQVECPNPLVLTPVPPRRYSAGGKGRYSGPTSPEARARKYR